MKPVHFRRLSTKFKRYTGLNLASFIDWKLSIPLNTIIFKMDEYLNFCEANGMKYDESFKEFNLRFFYHGDRVNAIIEAIIK